MDFNCKDCKYYLPVDVFRGMCKKTKEQILPEDPFCQAGEKLPKCRFCQHYSIEKEYLGRCRGTILAYADMVAVKCADFEWFRQN